LTLQVSVEREASVGREPPVNPLGPRPPALNCDAPSMGNPIGGMRSALPSGKTDKPLGEALAQG
jgi:hypothetical protein